MFPVKVSIPQSHKTLPILFGLLATAGLFYCTLALAGEADIVFRNGAIYTADSRDSIAEFLAVTGKRISFVGSEKDGEAFVGPSTEVVDLRGGMLTPGFMDTHIHTPGPLMPEMFDFNLLELGSLDPGDITPEVVLKKIRDGIAALPDREGYFGFGFPTAVFKEGLEATKGPRKAYLDAICSDKPVVIWAYDGHSAWLNSKAFEVAGITPKSVPPKGGIIELDPVTGELWGTLKEIGISMAPKIKPDREKLLDILLRYQKLLHSLGYTSILSATAYGKINELPWEELHELDQKGLLTLRIRGSSAVDSDDDIAERIAHLKNLRDKYDSEFLKLTTAKCFADGVLDTRAAFLLEPYSDVEGDSRGEQVWDRETLNKAVAAINAAGFQVHVHSIGDAATRMVLDAYQYARENAPEGDCRNTITHLQLVDPEDLGRFKALGAVASVQPYWHLKGPGFWEEVEVAAVGRERAEKEYPLKSFFDAGVVVTSSSDAPVTANPNALHAIQAGVTRNLVDGTEYGMPDPKDADDPTYLLWPEERATVLDMLRSFTINSAFTTFNEDDVGSLEVGKLADLVVLDTNILEVDPIDISRATVLRTYVNGNLVYDASRIGTVKLLK